MQFIQPFIPAKFQETVSFSPNIFLPPLKARNVVVQQTRQIPSMILSEINYGKNSAEDNSKPSSSYSSEDEMLGNVNIDKKGLKERNRVAAQKWRQKKDKYLNELEGANDQLRQKALSLCGHAQNLRVENKLLEDELSFFQSFMSKIMHAGSR